MNLNLNSHLGEMAALVTAICWTFTALAFEFAGKRVGSLAVNIIRLTIGFTFLTTFLTITRGNPFPIAATPHQWFWLSLSGLIGLLAGDLLLFRAFVIVGSRISLLIMALVPPMTTVFGWLVLKETLMAQHYFGMALTIIGVALVVLERPNGNQGSFKLTHPLSGILFAFGGAIGQAIGLILSKYGMGSADAFVATQIREIAGLLGFLVLFTLIRAWPKVGAAIKNRQAMRTITLGAFFGPFLGISFSLLSLKYTTAGVASTIMAITPVLIIPPSVLLFKEKVTIKEMIGALIAVGGVAILFLH